MSVSFNLGQRMMIQYCHSTIFVLGIIGSLINILLFSRSYLRSNSCCICKLFEKKVSRFWFFCFRFFSIISKRIDFTFHRYHTTIICTLQFTKSVYNNFKFLQGSIIFKSNKCNVMSMAFNNGLYRSMYFMFKKCSYSSILLSYYCSKISFHYNWYLVDFTNSYAYIQWYSTSRKYCMFSSK